MRRTVSVKSIKLAALVAFLGALFLATPVGFDLEEHAGLAYLFWMRGARSPPEDVLVVSIDKPSLERLCVVGGFPDKLCSEGKWWPRSLHADLIDRLSEAGADVIVFDMRFDVPRDGDDARLGAAMARAGRVAVAELLKREEFTAGTGKASRETSVPPIEAIETAALATAPFPLPRVPIRVNAYSPFVRSAGDVAVLPVTAFQIHALPAYAKLIDACPAQRARLPSLPADSASFDTLRRGLRKIMTSEPDVGAALVRCAQALPAADAPAMGVLDALLDVYGQHGMRYLDLYGPPQSIRTVGYAQALDELAAGSARERYSGKAVFVGVSEVLQPEQKDNYYTVFTRDDGVDLNGVELAATAYANLLENRQLLWDYGLALGLVLAWGFVIGTLARELPAPRAALLIGGLVVLYALAAQHVFAQHAIWLPLVVPLLLQAALAFALGSLAQYRELSREKNNIRRAFGHFLPDAVVDELARDVARIPTHSQMVSGTCLATDIGGYTHIAEKLDPGELRLIMNEYYAKVFSPVAARNGIVSDVVGDAMVAIWAAAEDKAPLREQACLAALDIGAAAEAFGRTPNRPALPTRIGLDSGQMVLGNVGGIGHYEYRAVGDIVNTASRIQGLNKLLGTQVLMSSVVLEGVQGVSARELGEFRLRGKSKPVTIYELVGLEADVTEDQRWLCSRFGSALKAFRAQRMQEARSILLDVIERFPNDGPTRFYLQLLEREGSNTECRDGVIAVSSE